MRTKRMSGDDFYTRFCTGDKTLRGCRKNGNSENVVIIDSDGDDDPDVTVIDVPDSLKPTPRGSSACRREREVPYPDVISIDDEDGDANYPGVSELDSDATSSKRSFPSPDISRNPADFDVGRFNTVRKEKFNSRLSKSQKSYAGKTPCRNRYGLSPESEDGSSESDCSDCEVLEGSSEELRKQWEKTYSKRKYKSNHGVEDQASTSSFHAGARTHDGREYRDEFCSGDPTFSFFGKDKVEENLSRHYDANSDHWRNGNLRNSGCSQSNKENAWFRSQKKGQTQFDPVKGNAQVGEETCTYKGPAPSQHDISSDSSKNFHNEDEGPADAHRRFNMMGDDEQNNCAGECSGEVERRNKEASCRGSSQSANCDDEKSDSYRSRVSNETNVPERGDHGNRISEQGFRDYSLFQHETIYDKVACYEEEIRRNQSVQKPGSSDGIGTTNNEDDKADLMEKSSANFDHALRHEEAHEKQENHVERSSPGKDQDPFFKSTLKTQCSEGRNGDCSPIIEDSVINGREKLKETDEYRRAQEEEWASRQQQLQLQAEEAQRLKKKKKAETLRIQDMERRQKQRVEEIRKTQLKDEENMNLKERLRAEIRKELSKLEKSCFDMPSLLRGLGIHVGSSPVPLSQEVHAAYKRAILRFHPDRASRSDIRQQVEAEEKFKLISRMKEKFLLTCCH